MLEFLLFHCKVHQDKKIKLALKMLMSKIYEKFDCYNIFQFYIDSLPRIVIVYTMYVYWVKEGGIKI